VLAHSYPSIKAQGICSLSIKRRLSIHCEPDLTTANCKRLPQKKCPLTKIKKLKNMTVSTEQISLAKYLLKTPQNASIMIIIPTRGRAKIKQRKYTNQFGEEKVINDVEKFYDYDPAFFVNDDPSLPF
jgi:hypothetical protein